MAFTVPTPHASPKHAPWGFIQFKAAGLALLSEQRTERREARAGVTGETEVTGDTLETGVSGVTGVPDICIC